MILPRIDKYREVNLGGARSGITTSSILVDISKSSMDDVRHLLKQITVQEVAAQENIGNEVNRLIVDGREGKSLLNAKYKTEVFFGSLVPRAAMSIAEQVLAEEIRKYTNDRTGRLSDIRGSWSWSLIQGGNRKQLGGPQEIKKFGFRDRLILSPKVKYAGVVNRYVKKISGSGFLKSTVRRMSQNSRLKSLRFSSGFSKKYQAPGEVYRHGTPFIMISGQRSGRRSRKTL